MTKPSYQGTLLIVDDMPAYQLKNAVFLLERSQYSAL